jgi:hypothetical protein
MSSCCGGCGGQDAKPKNEKPDEQEQAAVQEQKPEQALKQEKEQQAG